MVSRAEEGPWKGDSEAANPKGQKGTLGAFPLAWKEARTGEEAEHQRVSGGFCLSGKAVPTGRLPPASGGRQSPPRKSCPDTEGPATSSKDFLGAERVWESHTTDLR